MNRQYTKWMTAGAAFGLLFVSAAPSFAQERTVVRQRSTTQTTSTTKVTKLSGVMKSKVVIQQDEPAGRVVDFVLSDGGCIEYVVASYEDEYYVIPYSAVEVRYADSLVFVDITPAQFKKVQFFATDDWPDLTVASYRDKVFSTFNVNAARRESTTTFKRDAGDVDRDRRDSAQDRRDDRRDSAQDRRDSSNRDDAKRDDPPRKDAPKDDLKPAPKPEAKDNPPKRDDKPAPKADDKPAPKADDKPAPKPDDKKPIAPRDEKKPEPKKPLAPR